VSSLDDMIVAGRSVIGTTYGWWGGGALEAAEPMFMEDGYSAEYVRATSINCAGLINWMAEQGGGLRSELKGGTYHYGNLIYPWEVFDPSRWYPVGSVPVQRYREGVSEGHVGMICRPNQLMLQSDTQNGVNELKTAAEQHEYTPFDWIGWLPGVPAADGLPGPLGGTLLAGVEGYPGDTATPEETAAWMGRVAKEIYGLPPELPVMCSLVELSQAWSGPGDVKDVPGYLYAVDHDSLGWFQQRPSQGWGTPEQLTDAEYALAKFLDAALKAEPSPRPTDAEGLGAWIQSVQVSAFPDRYSRQYDRARALLGTRPEPERPDWQRYGWIELHSPGAVTLHRGEG
jgi:hypothetical protein